MRLSLVFELLLIFILLAFAASRVIGKYGTDTQSLAATTLNLAAQKSPLTV
jgi:hypothetical protein